MPTTVVPVTESAYVDLGAGPLSLDLSLQGKMRVHVGTSLPAADTDAYHRVIYQEKFIYGGTENVYARAHNGLFVFPTVTAGVAIVDRHGGSQVLTSGGGGGGSALVYTKDNIPTTQAELYHGANVKLSTAVSGINVFGTAFTTLSLIDGDGQVASLTKQTGGNGDLVIQNKEHGGEFYLKAEGAAGSVATLLRGNADAETSLYFDGDATLQTTANGADVTTSVEFGDTHFGIVDGDLQVGEIIKDAAGPFKMVNLEHGQTVVLAAEDAGGIEQPLFIGDPAGAATLYYDGGATLQTTANGIDVTTTVTNGSGTLSVTEDSGEYTEMYVSNANKKFYIQNRSHGAGFAFRGEDATGAVRAYFTGEDDGACYFMNDGDIRFVTEATGARIESEGDTSLNIEDGDGEKGAIMKEATGDFVLKNYEHSANMEFRLEDNLGVEQTMMKLDPDAGVYMYWDGGAQVFRTVPTGIQVNGTTADAKIQMYDLNSDSAEISKENSGNFVITNLEKEGHIVLTARKAGVAGYATGFEFDPDTGVAFNGATPIAAPDVTGSRGGNAALASVLTALANLGLITDSST